MPNLSDLADIAASTTCPGFMPPEAGVLVDLGAPLPVPAGRPDPGSVETPAGHRAHPMHPAAPSSQVPELWVDRDGNIGQTDDEVETRSLSRLTGETFAASTPSTGGAAPLATDAPIIVLDSVLADIEATIAGHAPERGGALFGSPELDVVSGFVYDRWAVTTGASYNASLRRSSPDDADGCLEDAVHLVEQTTPLRYLGTVHSHPGRLDRPSGQDLVAFADTLRLNAALPAFQGPIVTCEPAADIAEHEAHLASGKLSWFTATATGTDRRAACRPRALRVLPLGRELEVLADRVGGEPSTPWAPALLNGQPMLSVSLDLGDGRTAQILLVPATYPVTGPTVLLHDPDTGVRQLPITWQATLGRETPLADAVTGALDTLAPTAPAVSVTEGLQRRLRGVVPPAITDAHVVVIGAGSVGSVMAEGLVRTGVGHLTVIDPDAVGPENLSRTVYTASDIDTPKVDALDRRLRAIIPDVTVHTQHATLADLDPGVLRAVVAGADLVVAATDDPRAQALANRLAYGAGCPAVFPGVYAKGHGGEVVFTIPELTRCYRCATSIRHSRPVEQSAAHDYGTAGRLAGEVALGADIAHITTAALKIAVALLTLRSETSPLVDEFLMPSMARGGSRLATMVQLSTVPDYSFFPQVFADVAGQGAWQTVWLGVEGDDTCPVCGDAEHRLDPDAVPVRQPSIDELTAALGEDLP